MTLTHESKGYWMWETEDFDDTEADAQYIASIILSEVVRMLAYPMYGVRRCEHELQTRVKEGGGSVLLVDEYRCNIEDATARVAIEVAPLLASRQETIQNDIRNNDRRHITALFGEAIALALAGVDRWYPTPEEQACRASAA